MKYKIAADSSANLYTSADIAFAGAGEDVNFVSVPLKIVTSEREYTDEPGMDVEEMVAYLHGHKGRSGTSCPNVHDWLQAFGDADVIFGVCITSNLSGSYASAVQARDIYLAEHPSAKIHLVDSLSAGPEMELIVEKMAEVIQTGAPFEEMCRQIDDYCKRSHLLFALEHLDNLARNGRVNPAAAKIAGVLGIRILGKASAEGTLQQLHKCRGAAHVLSRICEEMDKNGYRGGKVRLAHCLNPALAVDLTRMLHRYYPKADIKTRACTGLCSFYAEQGGLMIGFESKEPGKA